jgi:protein-S-isoprenylcysteine O-methyltransferase Ste14
MDSRIGLGDGIRVPPAARIPPPLLFVAVFLIGFSLHRWLLGASPALRIPGIVATGLGLALMLWTLGLFAHGRTTLIPHGAASTLVIRGPYRRSRNPMYVSLVIVYIGVSAWTGAWTALALVVIPVFVLDRFVIPMEEANLHQRFGESYAAYCRAVGRWV